MTSWLYLLMLVGVLFWAVHKVFGKSSPVNPKTSVEPSPHLVDGPQPNPRVDIPGATVVAPPTPIPAIEIIQPISSFGGPLHKLIGTDLVNTAYWQVMSELQGDGLTPDLVTALKPAFIDALGDSRRAGRLLVDRLDGIAWDWPRWYSFAKHRGYSTVKDIRQDGATLGLQALLSGRLKADLMVLAESVDIVFQKSISKKEIIEKLMQLPPEMFRDWTEITRKQWLEKQLTKVYREMGGFIAGRVMSLEYGEHSNAQRSDPETIRFHPYWRFICPEDCVSTAPKKCRELDQRVLPAAEAMNTFPKIPCSRLDCQCRITTQRRVDEIAY